MVDSINAVHVAGSNGMQRREPAGFPGGFKSFTDSLQNGIWTA